MNTLATNLPTKEESITFIKEKTTDWFDNNYIDSVHFLSLPVATIPLSNDTESIF